MESKESGKLFHAMEKEEVVKDLGSDISAGFSKDSRLEDSKPMNPAFPESVLLDFSIMPDYFEPVIPHREQQEYSLQVKYAKNFHRRLSENNIRDIRVAARQERRHKIRRHIEEA
jgi:hypothetical protein